MLTHPRIDPVALQLGPLAIHWYGLTYLAAFGLFLWLGRLRLRHPPFSNASSASSASGAGAAAGPWSRRDVEDILFLGVAGVVLGGRLGYCLFYRPGYYLANPLEIFALWQGGMAFHGGLLGASAAMLWFAHSRQRPLLQVADFVAPCVPTGLAAGRLGNFINGELWGRFASPDLPWAMVFAHSGSLQPRHPSQIYQFLLEGLLLFAALWCYARRERRPGQVAAAFLFGYGVLRFIAEYFRAPDSFLGILSLGMSMGQWLCLPMIAGGAGLWLWAQAGGWAGVLVFKQQGGKIKMRDPDGRLEFYERKIDTCVYRLNARSKTGDRTDEQLCYRSHSTLSNVVEYMLLQYGRGDRLADIWAYFDKDGWPAYQRDAALVKQLPSLDERQRNSFIGLSIGESSPRDACFFLAFLICLDESPKRLLSHRNWLSINPPCRFVDVILKSFIPQYQCFSGYKSCKYREWWMTPLLDALAQPAGQRPAALAAHMNGWHQLMRRSGWKPKRDPAPEKDGLFCDFAFEVALAVCAWDIDDSGFRDHPHYPRDLVDHYRQHVRHTRDAWRGQAVGAGIQLPLPAPPKRSDLAQSKRKNFARWLELACDGCEDAVESVLETSGKPREIKDFQALLNALDEAGHAIHADIKENDVVSGQAADLADARGIGPFEAPDSDPPQGPGRCTAILLALAARAAPRGYRLIDIDLDDDAWHALLVRSEYHEEFLALSRALGLRTRTPQQAYCD